MIVVKLVLAVAATALGAIEVFLLFLSVASLGKRAPMPDASRRIRRFAVVIPAHDEETVLPVTLQSLEKLTYPLEAFDIHVIADNCCDGTAEVVRNWQGLTQPLVHVRDDSLNRGKGHAVRWALDRLLIEQTYDAFMMLDADWTVSSNLLDIANAYLDRGEDVVQVWCRVAQPTATWATGLRSISFALVNYVRPLGLDRLGLSCGLKGTGMAFTAEIIRRHGWQSTSLIEDAEEHIRLILHGHRVAFAPEATIESLMPPTLKASTSQNLRWESGKIALVVAYVPMLLRVGLTKPSLDAAVEAVVLTIPPLTVTVAALAGMLGVSLATRSRLFLTVSLVLWGGLLSHMSLGVYAARLPVRLLVSVLLAPSFVVWKLRLYAGALSSRGKGPWIRTERASEGTK